VNEALPRGRLLYTDGPRIRCDATSAFVGDRDVYLRCVVKARPPPIALYWVLDSDNSSSSTRLGHGTAGHYGQDYWTVATVRTSRVFSRCPLMVYTRYSCSSGVNTSCECSVLFFFSRPRSEGWPHHGRTFFIYPCPLSF